MTRVKSFAIAIILVMGLIPAAFAKADWVTYTPEAFGEAQRRNEIVLVDVHADWCPTCRAQKPTLDSLLTDPALEKVVFIKVNFDNDRDFLRSHRIARQSTIVVFHGEQEVARSVAETDPDQLRAFVHEAVAR